MKTLRYRLGNDVKPGILDQDENIRDASSIVNDWDNENVTIEKLDEVKNIDINSLPIVESHDGFAPCVCRNSIGKFICIGLNYADHAKESGLEVPPEPVIFFKATSAIISEKFSGFILLTTSTIPLDSSWKMPLVLPDFNN